MRCFSKLLALLFALASMLCITILYHKAGKTFKLKRISNELEVIISVVVCGESRIDELLTMVKSGLVFSKPTDHLKFIVISEKPQFQLIREKLESFQNAGKDFSFELKEIKFPEENMEIWRKLFKLCASQRLFLPSLLPEVKAVLYVDSDVIFLSPPQDIFKKLQRFNSSQIAGLVSESENKKFGWYSRFARHPFYG